MAKTYYTDLALDTAEALCGEKTQDFKIDGVTVEKKELSNAEITWVRIINSDGEKTMGKPVGSYITIESEAMKESDIDVHEEIVAILAEALSTLTANKNADIRPDSSVLVVGLGNRSVTPDALGPNVVSKMLVTRHIMDELPESTGGKIRQVAAVAPGVMGTTGIETFDIIKGICDEIKPSLVIAIDALAARCANRVNATIQVCDTGLSPGAGMGNNRKVINENFLGIPVIAVGVPTVVDAATLVSDTMDLMLESMLESSEEQESSAFYEMLRNLEEQEKYGLIKQVLDPYMGNMFVTPKEVDSVIDRLSNIIANALNISLHPGIGKNDINRFMY